MSDLALVIQALLNEHGADAVNYEVRHAQNKGTHGGYTWHQYNKSEPCAECRAGESEYQNERQRLKKLV